MISKFETDNNEGENKINESHPLDGINEIEMSDQEIDEALNSDAKKFKNLRSSFVTKKIRPDTEGEMNSGSSPNASKHKGILKMHPLVDSLDEENDKDSHLRRHYTEPRKRKVKFTIDEEADEQLRKLTEQELTLMRSRKKIKGMTILQILKKDKPRRILIIINSLGWMVKLMDFVLFNIW